jgi:hypothetical protein
VIDFVLLSYFYTVWIDLYFRPIAGIDFAFIKKKKKKKHSFVFVIFLVLIKPLGFVFFFFFLIFGTP